MLGTCTMVLATVPYKLVGEPAVCHKMAEPILIDVSILIFVANSAHWLKRMCIKTTAPGLRLENCVGGRNIHLST